jgi:PRTRC genetic system ThiF family protein
MARQRKTQPKQRHRWQLTEALYPSPRPITIAVVGVGGTGSEVVSNLINLHLGLQALGQPGITVTAFDGDVVSEANIVRQRYTPSDLGRSKAITLCERICLAYAGLDFRGVQANFEDAWKPGSSCFDLLISCVDTRSSRATLHNLAMGYNHPSRLWLDCGNTSRTGQVILGTPGITDSRKHRLPNATEIHPELMDTTLPDDNTPSCSALAAIRSQDLFVNKRAALVAVDLLWELFREGSIEHHGCYFDLRARSEAPLFVPAPPPQRGRRRRPSAAAA